MIESNDTLATLSTSMATAVSRAARAVVQVDARRRLPASGLIWAKEGLVITAHHVARRDQNINVRLHDGRLLAAQLVGRDPTTDLALLQIPANDAAPLPAAESEPAVGNLVLALGRPGQGIQATIGVISALGESWRTRTGGQIDQYLQTDVLMYPGFSGGPLIDANGALLGLNTSGLSRGISLTIPRATLGRVVEALQSHGRIRRGYLGVSTQQAALPPDAEKEAGQEMGLLIVSVEPDSPAAAGGLTLGDTIIALGDAAITSHDELVAQLSGDQVGRTIAVAIVRGGEIDKKEVTIGERP
jgi:S1-C subfamily serine protease